MFDNRFMRMALDLAKEAANKGEVPIGAVIVESKTNKIISTSHNLSIKHNNPLMHAEMLALNYAFEALNSFKLNDYDIYVTLEPCPMCAYAISLANIKRIYFAAQDAKGGGIINGPRVFQTTSCASKPEIYEGIMEQEARELLQNFFQVLRK